MRAADDGHGSHCRRGSTAQSSLSSGHYNAGNRRPGAFEVVSAWALSRSSVQNGTPASRLSASAPLVEDDG